MKKEATATEATEAEATAKGEAPLVRGNGRNRGPKRLTLRDRHLLGVLATARCLSTTQLWRLFFPGRQQRTAEQSLEALAGHGRYGMRRALLKWVTFRGLEGNLLRAWTLTGVGYVLAEDVLGRVLRVPDGDIGFDFLEHTLQLNELFTALLEPPQGARVLAPGNRAPVFARAEFQAFRWTSSETARLPWREYDVKAGRRRERVILPDAVVELAFSRGADSAGPPRPRDLASVGADPDLRFKRDGAVDPHRRATGRRLFLECEMGTHTIVAKGGDKPGSTIAKVERYQQYMRRYADVAARQTFYEAQYGDGLEPEVVFLVRSPIRAEHVNQALAAWRKTCQHPPVSARAVTFPQAVEELSADLGLPPAGAPIHEHENAHAYAYAQVQRGGFRVGEHEHGGSPDQLKLIKGFFSEATRALQAMRHQIRALPPEVRAAHGLTEPSYPANTRAIQELLARTGATP